MSKRQTYVVKGIHSTDNSEVEKAKRIFVQREQQAIHDYQQAYSAYERNIQGKNLVVSHSTVPIVQNPQVIQPYINMQNGQNLQQKQQQIIQQHQPIMYQPPTLMPQPPNYMPRTFCSHMVAK